VNKGAPQLALRTAQEVISLGGKNTRGRKDKQAVAELNHSLNPDIQSEGKLGILLCIKGNAKKLSPMHIEVLGHFIADQNPMTYS
jgi:hypothetical protein